ncbi:hypothetical protein AVEN_136937-1 [Araneus ventricosus]|uniref:Uncharacterized protein n=1 Tax=Araneus ventricosus TaxID=182803 RepID=A0A4Y2BHM2_ARAVE|nr:hypothetical protein AVEN_136937-1 [Araneus ventricosus]
MTRTTPELAPPRQTSARHQRKWINQLGEILRNEISLRITGRIFIVFDAHRFGGISTDDTENFTWPGDAAVPQSTRGGMSPAHSCGGARRVLDSWEHGDKGGRGLINNGLPLTS